MEITVHPLSSEATVTYNVEAVDASTFRLRLKHASAGTNLPVYLKVFKTAEGWQSAYEGQSLIEQIGAAIEAG